MWKNTKQQSLQLLQELVKAKGSARWSRKNKKGGCIDRYLQNLFDKSLVASHARQVKTAVAEFIVVGDAFKAKCAADKGILRNTAAQLHAHQEKYLSQCWKACSMAGNFIRSQADVSAELAKVPAAATLFERYKLDVTRNAESTSCCVEDWTRCSPLTKSELNKH